MRPAQIAGAALVVLVGATVATSVLLIRGHPGERGPDRVETVVGAVRLRYHPSYARFGPGRTGGSLDRVEMAVSFPDLRGAGRAAERLPADEDAQAGGGQLVFLTLQPEDDTADPAERTASLYSRFLQPDVWQEANGLVMRRFETGSPYDREQLHFVPPEGRLFAARCVRPTQPPSDLPSTCLSVVRSNGLDVDIRFSPALLPRWEQLTDGVRRLVGSFRVD